MRETIIIMDFGGQYNQLIARRIRECNVYCEVHPHTLALSEITKLKPKGIIFTGGPNSVNAPDSLLCDKKLFSLNIPILGICYGAQLIAKMLGGTVASAPISEYGKISYSSVSNYKSALFNKLPNNFVTWMSHTDYIEKTPPSFVVSGYTNDCPVAAMENAKSKIYATQFHPEVMHTEYGLNILRNFAINICGCKGDWQMAPFAAETINKLRQSLGNSRVLLALSGGVDSAVASALLSRAIGKRLTCVFVDHGLMRKDEGDEVEGVFGKDGDFDIDFIRVNAAERFFKKLSGVTEPERKRKIIGNEFIEVFKAQAQRLKQEYGDIEYFAQGTVYPDVIESGLGDSATIKSHHNVGGLPKELGFKEVIEPLRMLFKDEVRQLGLELGLPRSLVFRQPFPGPGLGIMIIGEVTPDKVAIVQEADAIYREVIDNSLYKDTIGQYYAAFPGIRTVGVMGDERTYDNAIVLRAVDTSDFMTANASRLPWDMLETAANRIVNEVAGVNRVFYDCTSKPPGTIELE